MAFSDRQEVTHQELKPDFKLLFPEFAPERLELGASMTLYSSFRAGGTADCLIRPRTREEVKLIAHRCRQEGLALTVLGCGSNILVSDRGLRGVCMIFDYNFSRIAQDPEGIHAQAGAMLCQLSAFAAARGITGLEFLAGIPGSVGGAALMNAGAYEHSISEQLLKVDYIDSNLNYCSAPTEELDYSYRHSRLSDDASIILGASFKANPGDPKEIYRRMAEMQLKRRESQPLAAASAGSAFKRPPGHFAGKLISDAGLKGWKNGRAAVSDHHAGFIVNLGGATASEIRAVFTQVQASVKEKFAVELEAEVRFIGDWEEV